MVKRIVWLPDAASRAGVREALRAAGVTIDDLLPPGAAPAQGR
jgi:hypothetical protein